MPYSFVGESGASPDPLRSPLAAPIHHLCLVYGGLAGAEGGQVYLCAIFSRPHTLARSFNLLIQSPGDKYNPHFLPPSFFPSLFVSFIGSRAKPAGEAEKALVFACCRQPQIPKASTVGLSSWWPPGLWVAPSCFGVGEDVWG